MQIKYKYKLQNKYKYREIYSLLIRGQFSLHHPPAFQAVIKYKYKSNTNTIPDSKPSNNRKIWHIKATMGYFMYENLRILLRKLNTAVHTRFYIRCQ